MSDLDLFSDAPEPAGSIERTFGVQPVRIVMVGSDPWFVAADVCAALGLTNVSMVVGRLDSDGVSLAEVIDSMGRTQSAKVVSEAGLYEMILRSDKPAAKQFRRWVTGEVLPEIRRTGAFGLAGITPTTFPEALRLAADLAEAAEAKQRQLDAQVPAVEAFDSYLDADGVETMAQVAHKLGIGRTTMMRRLREEGILQTADRNLPMRQYDHLFKVVSKPWERGDKSGVRNTTFVRPEGVELIRRRLGLGSVTA